MTLRRLIIAFVISAAALATAAPADAARSSRTRYEQLVNQSQGLRLDGRKPAPLSQIRRLVNSYEAIVRRYPSSGYADNALWNGAELSFAAFRIYGSGVDRDRAARLLKWLLDEYPASSLRTKARQLLKQSSASETARSARNGSSASSPVSSSAVSSVAVPSNANSPASAPIRSLTTDTARSEAPSAIVPPASVNGVSATGATLRDVKRLVLPDMVRVTLEFDGVVEYRKEELAGPARLYFDFKNTQSTPSLQDAAFAYEDDTVRHIRVGRPKADMTRLVIDLKGVARYNVFTLHNPYRLTIDLERENPTSIMTSAKRPAATTASASAPPPSAPPPAISSPMVTPVALKPVATLATSVPSATSSAPAIKDPTATAAKPRDLPKREPPRPLPHPLHSQPTPGTKFTGTPVPLPQQPLLPGRRLTFPARPLTPFTTPTMAVAALLQPKETRASRRAAAAPIPRREVAPKLMPPPVAPPTNTDGNFSLARQLGMGVARIVIDPGHGGHDPGSLGSRVTEAEVVLDVALRLEKLLQKEAGFEVIMTRRTDVFIPLEERPAIANRQQADLFLSIHANSSRNREAHGVETYFLNFASNPEAEAVAARENAGAKHTMNHMPEIVRAIAMNNKLDESRDFASMVQETMVDRLRPHNNGMKDRGVKQAPLVVLIGAGMPSVLAEIAFVSNSEEGGLVKTGNYRQKIAEALFEAVLKYQRTLKTVGTVASQMPDLDEPQDPHDDEQREP